MEMWINLGATAGLSSSVNYVKKTALLDKPAVAPSFRLRLKKTNLTSGDIIMSGKTDVVKGRIKEAAGVLTGSEKLRAEGQTDQVVGKTKQAVQKAADTVKKAVKKAMG
jgi:uncharacterized protein YjbJ (UPF0337 family)